MNTDITHLVEQLAEAITRRPVIPIDRQLWTADDVAQYLRVNRRAVMERYAPLPNFPQPIRIPAADNKVSRPRWKAVEVMRWAERHQEPKRRA